MIRLVSTFIILLTIVLSLPAIAQEMTSRQNEILKNAISADGWLTEAMHKEFWAAVPENIKSDPKALEIIFTAVEESSIIALQFQREAWVSMKMSLAARKVVRTPNYEAVKTSVLKLGSISNSVKQIETNVRNAEAMIEAAAFGKPMAGPRGNFYVTEELVEQVLLGLDGSFFRFRRLANPVWSYKVNEYPFPDLHIRILWDSPFRKEISDMVVEGGRSVKVVMLDNRLSEKDQVGIGFIDMKGRWADPEKAATRTALFSLKAMGISEAKPVTYRWRNRVSAEVSGTAMTSDGPINASVRIVEAPEYGGFWQILGISTGSLIEAVDLREILEKSIQID